MRPCGKKRILVADSDGAVRRTAHELLGRYGCIVETAHNGEEALLMARSFHYDAVIADIRLPDMNGADCFRRIREIHEFLPVILMTGFGYDSTHSIVKARQMGLQSVLYKPFRLDQLLAAVEQAVTGASSEPPPPAAPLPASDRSDGGPFNAPADCYNAGGRLTGSAHLVCDTLSARRDCPIRTTEDCLRRTMSSSTYDFDVVVIGGGHAGRRGGAGRSAARRTNGAADDEL